MEPRPPFPIFCALFSLVFPSHLQVDEGRGREGWDTASFLKGTYHFGRKDWEHMGWDGEWEETNKSDFAGHFGGFFFRLGDGEAKGWGPRQRQCCLCGRFG